MKNSRAHAQRGSFFVGLVIFLLASSLALTLILQSLRHFNEHRQARRALLCYKNFKSGQRRFIKNINWANRLIVKFSAADRGTTIFSILFPGSGVLLKGSLKKILKALKLYQEGEAVLYLKNFLKLRQDSCALSSLLPRVPYQTSFGRFTRDHRGATIVKDHQWRTLITSKAITIIVTSTLKNAQVQQDKTRASLVRLKTKEMP